MYHLHEKIGSLVYFDPVHFLPNEIILLIFAHLSPRDLLTASLVSHDWRERTRDERLWRNNFGGEGWRADPQKLLELEALVQRKGVEMATDLMRSRGTPQRLKRRSSRKRARDEAFSENESTRAQVGNVEEAHDDSDETMEGIEASSPSSSPVEANHVPATAMTRDNLRSHEAQFDGQSIPKLSDLALRFKPTMFTANGKPSWPWMYKYRRLLERNWDTGTYTSFRLPHPDHEEEGHRECVYTIQHSGNHLVSGSRDKTIRCWDLTTNRLRIPELYGHDASVLCLQFDERPGPEHDIIISGGSDNLVIIWQFSTGKLLKKMSDAHTESVLNLRFDDRYLVTCSKDKTIKIWNRHEIATNDKIIPKRQLEVFDSQLVTEPTLPPFTLLDTLEGHQAAVNAVQINGDIIVSASGDRTIKSWDIHNTSERQNHKKSYTGHTKGIACVQFDGRRIVSGSSDNSVRIFDYDTTAEVACLDGHSNLVRTVQARFGDLETTTNEELYEEAKQADKEFLKALKSGMAPAEPSRRRLPRNAGSNRPQDMLSYGTKIPPGGGGSKWAKIVSGSYDETIIIWKRDPNKAGRWKPNQRLQQGQLTAPDPRRRPNDAALPNAAAVQGQMQPAPQAAQIIQQAHTGLNIATNALMMHPGNGQQQGLPLPPSQLTAIAAAQSNLNTHLQQLAGQQHQHAMLHGVNAPGAAATHAMQALANQQAAAVHQAQAQQGQGNQQPAPQQAAAPAPAAAAPHHHHHHHAHAHGHHHHHAHAAHGGHGAPRGDSNRVFKLQFDARRIIACSQNKVIVGWDFAAGDKDLELIGDWSTETS